MVDEEKPITREEVQRMLDQLRETIIVGIEGLLVNLATKDDTARIENKIMKARNELYHLDDRIKRLNADFSTTPSRKEFERRA